MFPCLRAHATFVADAKFASETQKMFLNFFRNILRPQQMPVKCFLVCVARKQTICSASHSFARRGNITSNNVSATMFPRLQGPLEIKFPGKTLGMRFRGNPREHLRFSPPKVIQSVWPSRFALFRPSHQ